MPEQPKKAEGIPSPFVRPPGRMLPVKEWRVDIQRPKSAGGFLETLAFIFLIITGIAAAWAFNDPYPLGSAADIVASLAFSAWNAACALAIIEHSRQTEDRRLMNNDNAVARDIISAIEKHHAKGG